MDGRLWQLRTCGGTRTELQADIQHLSYVTTCCPAAVTGLGDHGGFLPTHVIHFQLLGSKELQSRELLHVSASKYD